MHYIMACIIIYIKIRDFDHITALIWINFNNDCLLHICETEESKSLLLFFVVGNAKSKAPHYK